MEIIDLDEKHLGDFLVCLEPWSEEMKDAGDHKALWRRRMKDKGLRIKVAVDGDKTLGMIQYVPIEHGFAEGRDAYFVHCIWVHGYKQGVGNHQKRGIGKALLKAAEEDAAARGAKGMAAWGISLPFFMKASWFKKQGYVKVDKTSIQILMWKPFVKEAVTPKWIKEKKRPQGKEGIVVVTSFFNGWCPGMNMTFERAKRAAAEFGDKVEFQAIPTIDRDVFLEWGIPDALFIDGKNVRTGPPPSFEKIHKKIMKKVKRLKK
ncbi:MAG: GNAT family N-acetyltransferase [Candidatus Aminicenantes bacterium]|nr:GNAT family N-acetyltransferase [Candidatus Aminicenantes bacterium]